MSTTSTQLDAALAVRASAHPLQPTGALDRYKSTELTPVIGREYLNVQLSDLLAAEDSDELIRELAIIVSQRNVVFFRNQDLTIDQQKLLGNRLGILSGRPTASGLHIHPSMTADAPFGPEVTVITSKQDISSRYGKLETSSFASKEWHSDITFEPVPSDFAILKMHALPPTGGDTVWASSYEVYDRLSPPFAAFLEGLTALHDARIVHNSAAASGTALFAGPRGHPATVGTALEAVHPVVRTNPVTGWKGVFVNKNFTRRILELTQDESDAVLAYLHRVVAENHDLQVRHRWTRNDVAVWANASTVHNITRDYDGFRQGLRVVSLGERPYFDPASTSRREALGQQKRIVLGAS